MKKASTLITLFLISHFCGAQIINFTDPVFKAKLLEADVTNHIAVNSTPTPINIDSNNDGQIQVSEALQVQYLDVSDSGITALDGINSFTNLWTFTCTY